MKTELTSDYLTIADVTRYTVTCEVASAGSNYTNHTHAKFHQEVLNGIPHSPGLRLRLSRSYRNDPTGTPYWRLELAVPQDPTSFQQDWDENMNLTRTGHRDLAALIARQARIHIDGAPARIAAATAQRRRIAAEPEAEGLIESSCDLAALLTHHAPTTGDPTHWDAITIPVAAENTASFAVNQYASTSTRLVLADLPYAADCEPDGQWRPAQHTGANLYNAHGHTRITLDWLTVTVHQPNSPPETTTHRTPAAALHRYHRIYDQLFTESTKP